VTTNWIRTSAAPRRYRPAGSPLQRSGNECESGKDEERAGWSLREIDEDCNEVHIDNVGQGIMALAKRLQYRDSDRVSDIESQNGVGKGRIPIGLGRVEPDS
jgi:hypothetical protein